MDCPHLHSTNDASSEIYFTCTISDAGSTASNLSGPGRALDRLFGHLGAHLELLASKVSMKMGKGPVATAKRIRQNRAEMITMMTSHSPYCFCNDCKLRPKSGPRTAKGSISPAKLRALHQKLRKDCGRLVDYIKCVQLTLIPPLLMFFI